MKSKTRAISGSTKWTFVQQKFKKKKKKKKIERDKVKKGLGCYDKKVDVNTFMLFTPQSQCYLEYL